MPPIRLLIVDDNREFLTSAERFLAADPGLDIIGHALSGDEALGKVNLLQPDVVLMDLVMPEMSGLEATRRIKTRANPPFVIILTLHDIPEYCSAAQAAQADGFIGKSNFGNGLIPLIHALMDDLQE
jgi:DNA-binding NarL/FixJ family response regulator